MPKQEMERSSVLSYRKRFAGISFTVCLVIALFATIALVGMLMIGAPFGTTTKMSSAPQAPVIRLLAAAGLREPIEEIARQYEAECGVKVDIQFGGSNTLLSQIQVDRIGTPDLLLAADEYFTRQAVEKKLAIEVFDIALQHPCVVVKKDSEISIRSIEDLMVDSRRLSLGNPDQAAIGKSVRDAMRRMSNNAWERLESHVSKFGVFKPTVNEVANDVRIGSVDAGIVWNATIASPAYRESLRMIDLPEFAEQEEVVSMAVLTSSLQPTSALKFARYVAAQDRGLRVFRSHGLAVRDGDDWVEKPEVHFYCGTVSRRVVEPIVEKFQQREGITIHAVYNGCGILTGRMKTIQNQSQSLGFPDFYMACDRYYLDSVKQWFQDDVDISDVEIVMVVPKGVTSISEPRDLLKPGIRVAIGQPEQCAIGALTERLLRRDGIYDSLKQKQLEASETVIEIASSAMLVPHVLTGHVDVAIAYLSDALPIQASIDVVPFEAGDNLAIQLLSVARNSRHKQLLRRFTNAIDREALEFEAKGFHFRRNNASDSAGKQKAFE